MRRINSNSCVLEINGKLPKSASKLEGQFQRLWDALGGPILEVEYQFYDGRKWRFDFCHMPSMTAIEIEGGTWKGGRHNRGSGYEADCHKYNAAAAMGYVVFRLTGDMITTPHIQPIVERCIDYEKQNFLR